MAERFNRDSCLAEQPVERRTHEEGKVRIWQSRGDLDYRNLRMEGACLH